MERVKIGEKYWFISELFMVEARYESNDIMDTELFKANNYFPASDYTPKMVNEMAEKIRKVLKDAEVIEMPNKPLGLTDIKNNHLRGYVPERLSINDLKAFALGFWEGCDWLASKIVKWYG